MANKGIYIFGVVPNFYGTDHFRSLENSGVYAITHQNISAVVCDREFDSVNFSDRESLARLLVSHQQTIESLMAKGFNMIIPMKLGTIVNSKEHVTEILAKGHELIIGILKNIEYYTEIDLAVTWADFGTVIRELELDEDVLALKQQMLQHESLVNLADQLKIGMLMKQRIDEKNRQIAAVILEAIAPVSINMKKHELMNDQMIANTAILLKRDQSCRIEMIICELDETFSGKLNFKMVGPLPCYSFYTIEVKELDPGKIENAGRILGLSEELTETELKKAYHVKAGLHHPDKNQVEKSADDFNVITAAYKILVEYVLSSRQSSKEKNISLAGDQIIENRIFVKIRE